MRISIIAFFLLAFLQLTGAQKKTTPLDSAKLADQFHFLITKTESYENYQVIKRSYLLKLKNNTLDTIKTIKAKQLDLINEVKDLKAEVSTLEAKLKETQDKLDTATKEKESLSFFGILITKSNYYVLMTTIILILIAALLVVFFMYKRSNTITVKTKETLASTQEEFERHRKWALEKEQKLSRELLKEKQKYKGII